MNTVLLETFVSVMETLSISQAAQDLHLTQPAITKRIQQLEEELGTNLFHLVGRKLQPTVQAIDFLITAKRWIKEYADLQTRLQHENSVPAGLLRLGTSHHIGAHHLEDLLREYVRLYPEVRLDIRFIDSEEAHELVSQGELEAAFLTFPPTRDPQLNYLPIWPDNLNIVVSNLHPLAKKQVVTLEELSKYQAILPRLHTYTTQLMLKAFEKDAIRPSLLNTNNSLDAIKMLISVGLGWSALPNTLVSDNLAVLKLTPAAALQRTLGLIWQKSRTALPAQQALIDLCQKMIVTEVEKSRENKEAKVANGPLQEKLL